MCGICCILQYGNTQTIINEDNSRIWNRGPDYSDSKTVQLTDERGLVFYGSVLHLRGNEIVSQPAQDDHGNILLWNGEIFDGIKVAEHESDTQILLSLLTQREDEEHVLQVMSKVQGPWSFIYWQAGTQTLWFGRDVFGRRSLLWHLPESDTDPFILSSVLVKPHLFTEVPSVGIFRLPLKVSPDLSHKTQGSHMYLYPWKDAVWPGTLDPVCKETFSTKIIEGIGMTSTTFHLCDDKPVLSQMPQLNKDVPTEETGLPPLEDESKSLEYIQNLLETNEYLRTLSRQLSHVLLEAVKKRVFNQQRKCNAAEKGLISQNSTNNVSFEEDSHINTKTKETRLIEDNLKDRIQYDKPVCENSYVKLDKVIEENSVKSENTSVVTNETKEEYGTTYESINGLMEACSLSPDPVMSSAQVAILFSGGIDSTVIAALADRCVPKNEPIDLINVAFEQKEKNTIKKKGQRQPQSQRRGWDVPDRLTGYVALSELNPDRTWNFIEVNVTATELQEMRQRHICELLYPLETVLDDSIGCAVWFAARGLGILGNGDRKGLPIHSQAKVILCGMGADEQLVGYSRHRVKFKTGGWKSLLEEIELELTRISARNLGRDDRIITDHGKESRFPFLDENVVKFLCSLPLHNKADLTLPRGLGEKLLLRLAAVELGLLNTATLPKRAIQFGSRIAKMENSKENARDKCDRLKTEL